MPGYRMWGAVALCAFAGGGGAEAQKTGRFQTSFAERSPYSQPKSFQERMPFEYEHDGKSPPDYDLAQETFEIYVPKNYSPEKPSGLFVWGSGESQNSPPQDWLPVLDAQNLIYAGANKAGNDRPAQWHRVGLILDAAHTLRKQYEIDPDRVYTGGLSGGGGQACIAALYHPDVFRGSFLMGCPVTFEAENEKGYIARTSFPSPPKAVYDQAKATQRYVLGAGSDDKLTPPSSVMPVAKGNYRFFKYPAVFFEVPGIGHARPPGEWLEKALVAMDNPSKASC